MRGKDLFRAPLFSSIVFVLSVIAMFIMSAVNNVLIIFFISLCFVIISVRWVLFIVDMKKKKEPVEENNETE